MFLKFQQQQQKKRLFLTSIRIPDWIHRLRITMNIPFYLNNPQLPYPLLNNNYALAEPVNSIPPGLQALYFACHLLYPDQYNPLQITSVRKYW